MSSRASLGVALCVVAALVACSGGSADDPEPTGGETSGSDGTETTDIAEPTEDEGVSPWGNSVADDDLSPDACAAAGTAPGPSCRTNSECGICHDGSACGRVANREEIERLGPACRERDSAACELAMSRCCEGTCRITPQ